MIGRRAALLTSLAASMPFTKAHAGAESAGVPPGGRLAFRAFRNDSEVGAHTLDFAADGDTLTVQIAVHFNVGFGPITLYRYDMRGIEQWVGGRFMALETQTDDDGRLHKVSVRRERAGLLVRSSGLPDRILDASALPLTHWSVACMSAPLFNPQDGVPIADRTVLDGVEPVRLESGRVIEAKAYSLGGEMAIRDWYDEAQLWVQLKAKVKDGSQIEYRRA
jgi:hypothetical protein